MASSFLKMLAAGALVASSSAAVAAPQAGPTPAMETVDSGDSSALFGRGDRYVGITFLLIIFVIAIFSDDIFGDDDNDPRPASP